MFHCHRCQSEKTSLQNLIVCHDWGGYDTQNSQVSGTIISTKSLQALNQCSHDISCFDMQGHQA